MHTFNFINIVEKMDLVLKIISVLYKYMTVTFSRNLFCPHKTDKSTKLSLALEHKVHACDFNKTC